MVRRLPAVALALTFAAGIAGCGTATDSPRATLLRDQKDLSNEELARLCPALYPSDFLSKPKDYGYTRDKKSKKTFSERQQAQAKAANCAATPPPPSGD